MKEVKKGSKGNEVFALQCILRMMGYYGKNLKPLTCDGEAGAQTMYAIKMFKESQKIHGCTCAKKCEGEPFYSECWNKMLGV